MLPTKPALITPRPKRGSFVSVMRCDLQDMKLSLQHVRDAARVTRPAALAVISMRVKVPTASECLIAIDDSHQCDRWFMFQEGSVPLLMFVIAPGILADGNSICQIRILIVHQLRRLNPVCLLTPVCVSIQQSHSVIAGAECNRERGIFRYAFNFCTTEVSVR